MTNLPAAPKPNLARLSFRVAPEQQVEFTPLYEAHLMPLLWQYGLQPSSEQGRPTPSGVFSRLFEVERPAAVGAAEQALQKDAGWQEALQRAGAELGIAGSLGHKLEVYRTRVTEGKKVKAGRGRGAWKIFGVVDGLPSDWVGMTYEDREGHLWFATLAGICRYDGQQFVTFTPRDGLAHIFLLTIAQDRHGAMWFGTSDGLSRYDGQGFSNFTADTGLAHNSIRSICEDRDGKLWIGTGGGVSRYDSRRFTNYTVADGLVHNDVRTVFLDHQERLWIGTANGLSLYDGQKFTNFTAIEGLPHNTVYTICQDRKGDLWFGTEEGICRYDGTQFLPFATTSGAVLTRVVAVYQDRKGRLWFGTSAGGVSCYDDRGVETFGTQDGLAGEGVTHILEDRQGYLWFSTRKGVSRYHEGEFTSFTVQEGVPAGDVFHIYEDLTGALWFATERGVCRYDGQFFETFTTEEGLAHNEMTSTCQDQKGNLWFSGSGGASRFDGQYLETFSTTDGLPENTLWLTYRDQGNCLWFGTKAGGLCRYDGREFRTLAVEDGLAHNRVSAVLQDRSGYLWVGTYRGVCRYDGERFKIFTEADGLGANHVRSILEDRSGNLWFVTAGGGVSCYDGQGFKTFSTAEGLAHFVVFSCLEDAKGSMWFGTWGGGVSCYDGQVFQTLTYQDGLVSNYVSSILQDRKGDIWFAALDGITQYRPSPPTPLPVFIDAVVADRRYEGLPRMELTDSVELVAFEFHAHNARTRPEAMVYRYRLEGYDEGWCNTHSRRVEYQDLPVGQYIFQVQAVDRDLNYSEPAEVRLDIVPDPRDQRIDELEERVQERTQRLEEVNATLRVEAALEKVRAEVGSMRKAEDLVKVGQVLCRALDDLTLSVRAVGINTVHEDERVMRFHGFSRHSGIFVATQQLDDPILRELYSHWQRGQVFHRHYTKAHYDELIDTSGVEDLRWVVENAKFESAGMSIEELRVLCRKLLDQLFSVDIGNASESDLRYVAEMENLYPPDQSLAGVRSHLKQILGNTYQMRDDKLPWIVDIPFSHGTVAMNRLSEPFSEREVGILQRFTEIVALGYLRYLDFQKIDDAQRRLIQELEDELQTAHDLQMGLMPKSPPHIPGLDIAGQCLPANHVGGDFFHYFQQEGTLSLCLADVTGHAMEAAVPGLMFSGVLKSQVELGEPLDLLFQRLNRTLHSTLDARTFVCFTMGQYDPPTGVFRLADAGCPYPYHYRAATGAVEELRVEAYPLGVRAEGRYPVLQTTLAPGDRVVFCSDGVIEAVNAGGEMFGFERTAAVVRQGCQEGLSAEGLLERIMQEVKGFRGEVAQGDDQTVVVLRVEKEAAPQP